MVNIKGFWGKKELPIILSVLVLVALGSWYAWHRHQNQIAQEQAAKIAALTTPPGWTTYKDTKRGFQFVYPKNWGPVNAAETPLKNGKTYTISFAFASEASPTPASNKSGF